MAYEEGGGGGGGGGGGACDPGFQIRRGAKKGEGVGGGRSIQSAHQDYIIVSITPLA